MVLKLYKLDASPPVRSVLCVIELLDIPDVQYENVNLVEKDQLSESFLKINPQHTVPTLVEDDFVIIDSHAIVTYLISKYGKDDSLYPSDLKKRAIIDHKLHFDSGTLFPALRGALVPVLFGGEQSFRPENLEKIKTGYDFIEKFLTGLWLAGDELTVADICCVTSISSMNEIVPIDEVAYPNLSAWLKRCSEQEFYKKKNAPGLGILGALIKSKIA